MSGPPDAGGPDRFHLCPTPEGRTMKRTLAVSALLAVLGTGFAPGAEPPLDIQKWVRDYDAAFNGKDLGRLASFYHPDVTIYEGGSINAGWVDYRDNHLGPELEE